MSKKHKCVIMMSIILNLISCATVPEYSKTVDQVDIQKFMGTWYVQAGRFTPFEKDVFNGVEVYNWNARENRIDIGFTYNQGSFDGPIKSLPQKGWIYNEISNAHWKVSPLWPLKFSYLIIGLDSNYQWTVIGVPDQKYVWLMTRDKSLPKDVFDKIVSEITAKGYNMDSLVRVQHK